VVWRRENLFTGVFHFGDDTARRGDAIFGFENGAANHDIIDSGAHGVPGRHHALLVVAL